jgi:dephospho-CoA kinase
VAEEPKKPIVIGLTGSIGMGKTETAKIFARMGIPVYDADRTVHALYDVGGLAVDAIRRDFPDAVEHGRVDRAKLADYLTRDKKAFERLERIVHPLVSRMRQNFLDAAARQHAEFVVLDIPLLFETGAEKTVDAVVVVSAPVEVQRKRVLARPGMTESKLQTIESRQVPDREKRAKADFVIDTSKGLDQAAESVRRVLSELRRRSLTKS